jgi:hypothetical protein
MSDPAGSGPLPRDALFAIILGFADSPGKVTDRVWGPGFFADARSKRAARRLETLCRKVIASYAPPKPPAFTAPRAGEDQSTHTTRENARTIEALEAREEFKEALAEVLERDEIFRLVPREAVTELLEIRDLLRSLPG